MTIQELNTEHQISFKSPPKIIITNNILDTINFLNNYLNLNKTDYIILDIISIDNIEKLTINYNSKKIYIAIKIPTIFSFYKLTPVFYSQKSISLLEKEVINIINNPKSYIKNNFAFEFSK